MAKVITFSRTFPSYHRDKGQPTYFVEKFLNQIGISHDELKYMDHLFFLNEKKLKEGKLTGEDIENFWSSLISTNQRKGHTIRSGFRFREGEFFSPRVWLGKPYNSPQIIFAPDTEIKSTNNFKIRNECIYINQEYKSLLEIRRVAKNDGLSMDQLMQWFKFPKPFNGQIICWNKNIKY